jgi:RNA polymerase sigma factor (sigma-70 family)
MPNTNTERRAEPATVGDGFEDFYRAQWSSAVRLAALLTQSSAAAEDLAQEAFTRLYPKWADATQPTAYLRASVANACRSWHARNRRERLKRPLLVDVEVAELPADYLADAVAALPYRQRAVLVLRYHAGCSEAEIAAALGCRPGTVKSLAARALARLEKVIER